MAAIDLTDINKTVQDSAYVAVGLGVLGFQRAQVRRRELIEALEAQRQQVADTFGSFASFNSLSDQRKQVTELVELQRKQVDTARDQLRDLARTVDERLAPARQQLETRVDELEQRLPATARGAFQSVRSAVTAPQTVLRNAVGLS